jgi:hypothetical protein
MPALPLCLVAPLVLSLCGEAPTAPQAGPRIGDVEYRRIERRANEFTASAQEAVALDADAAGRTVVV